MRIIHPLWSAYLPEKTNISVRNQLITDHFPSALDRTKGLGKKYARVFGPEEIKGLVGMGLLECVDRYDPYHESGSGFVNFAMCRIESLIRDAARTEVSRLRPRKEVYSEKRGAFLRKIHGALSYTPELEGFVKEKSLPSQTFENREFLAALKEPLDDRERDVIGMKYVLGMSQAEISRCFQGGTSEVYISGIHSRALEKMRRAAKRIL